MPLLVMIPETGLGFHRCVAQFDNVNRVAQSHVDIRANRRDVADIRCVFGHFENLPNSVRPGCIAVANYAKIP